MILIDMNQVMIANLMIHMKKNAVISDDLLRHMVLNSIRATKKKFSREYGEIVICCDDTNYWRKEIFPYYKAHRQRDREASTVDWNAIFTTLNKIREELKKYIPYRVLQVSRVEADDIIATLVKRFGSVLTRQGDQKILIYSGDHDFAQLQKYSNVEQFSPNLKKMIKVNDPEAFLKEHIIRGDKGDGIPNFLSQDDSVLMKVKQKSIKTEKLAEWINLEPRAFCDDNQLRNYYRNKQMVDMTMIPQEYEDKINAAYDNYAIPPRKGIYQYFVTFGLKNLIADMNDF